MGMPFRRSDDGDGVQRFEKPLHNKTKAPRAGLFAGGVSKLLMRGESRVYKWLIISTFASANAIIGAIFVGTVWLLVRGKLFPV